jgi:hypothetical protein
VQTQFTLFGEDVQVLEESKRQADETPGFERVSAILNRLFGDWDTKRARRARLETAMSGRYDAALSLCIDASVADEESISDEIAVALKEWEGAYE